MQMILVQSVKIFLSKNDGESNCKSTWQTVDDSYFSFHFIIKEIVIISTILHIKWYCEDQSCIFVLKMKVGNVSTPYLSITMNRNTFSEAVPTLMQVLHVMSGSESQRCQSGAFWRHHVVTTRSGNLMITKRHRITHWSQGIIIKRQWFTDWSQEMLKHTEYLTKWT